MAIFPYLSAVTMKYVKILLAADAYSWFNPVWKCVDDVDWLRWWTCG